MPKSNTSGSSVTAKSGPDSTVGATGGVANSGPFLTHHSQAGSTQAPSELMPSATGLEKAQSQQQLNVSTDMALVVRAMLQPDSGLEIHDRTWLKITIANAVIGASLLLSFSMGRAYKLFVKGILKEISLTNQSYRLISPRKLLPYYSDSPDDLVIAEEIHA